MDNNNAGLSDPLDADRLWEEICRNARSALQDERIFVSTKRGQRYRVAAVDEDQILITRVDGSATETLRRSDIARAVKRLELGLGRVPRQSLNYTVAKEVAMVEFSSRLQWDSTSDFIEMVNR